MATFKFTDYTYGRSLVLEAQQRGPKEADLFDAVLKLFDKNTNVLFETNAELRIEVFHKIFDWHESLSQNSEALLVPELSLKFEWGWHEKGELYFRTSVQTPKHEYVFYDHYQGPEHALMVANQMRSELGDS